MGAALIDLQRARWSLARQFLLDGFGYPSVTRDIARPAIARLADLPERFGGEAEIDAVEAADGLCFRIRMHGATLAPEWRIRRVAFLVCSIQRRRQDRR